MGFFDFLKGSTGSSTTKGGSVEFAADGKVSRVEMPGGQWSLRESGGCRYYTQDGRSLLLASELLKALPSVPAMTYYKVLTPDGTLCRDASDFYTEGPLKTSGLILQTSTPVYETVESVSLTSYSNSQFDAARTVAMLKRRGEYARLVLLMECGRCGYKSPVETEAGDMMRQCYCCGAANKTSRNAINVVSPDFGMVEI